MKQVTTLVEFFSDNTIDNVLGAFAFRPLSLIFLVDSGSHEPEIDATLKAMKRRLPETKVSFYRTLNREMESIQKALEELWRDHPDCVFDFKAAA